MSALVQLQRELEFWTGKAAKLKPRDAMERLDAEFAASQIED